MKELEEINNSKIGMLSAKSIHNYLQCEIHFALKTIFNSSEELKKNYLMFIKEAVNENRNGQKPDISIKEKKSRETVLIIEITGTKSEEDLKAIEYRKEEKVRMNFTNAEILVYDYTDQTWYKVNKKGFLENGGFCKFLGVDLYDITSNIEIDPDYFKE